ncbi:MAG: hypothetical protein LZF60_260011 [Nitrospira sp.]|nr:MAG: hypothetical protein LZF60_260011 [Nitrospira sp.]
MASWADEVRTKQTAPWQYVNIGIDEQRYDPARHCPRWSHRVLDRAMA